jgi:hypothetical protein
MEHKSIHCIALSSCKLFNCLLEGHRGTLYPQRLALTLPTGGGRSVGIVRSRTQAMEFRLIFIRRTQRSSLLFGKIVNQLQPIPVFTVGLTEDHFNVTISFRFQPSKRPFSKPLKISPKHFQIQKIFRQ